MPNRVASLNFNDTFLDLEHLKESFPGATVVTPHEIDDADMQPPFRCVRGCFCSCCEDLVKGIYFGVVVRMPEVRCTFVMSL